VNDSTWTWISGSSSIEKVGHYGEKGVPSTSNVPGPRTRPLVWYDGINQEFWLWDGYGYANESGLTGAYSLAT